MPTLTRLRPTYSKSNLLTLEMRLVNHSAGIIPGMTHFQPQRDASQREDEGEGKETEARLCSPCGGEFRPTRDWQKQCSPRCRQRAYVQRRAEGVVGYYGA